MPTPRHGLPYAWVTWITGLLSGEDSCAYAPWFKSHFRFTKVERDFDLSAWKASHAEMVNGRAAELRAEGWDVTVEDQNDFKLFGRTAILAGKADLFARRSGLVLVVDCKGGKQRDSDFQQVLIYMVVLPKAWAGLARQIDPMATVRGEVCYRDHRITIEPEQVTPAAVDRVFALMRVIGSEDRPGKVPSSRECAFCDISADDCPERVVEVEQPVMSSEF